MNNKVIKNPNFNDIKKFHQNLELKGKGAKDWINTHTEIENLGGGKFGASIGIKHEVFFDKTDGNKAKKHKLTDERENEKDYILVQSAKCCVEVHLNYATYFDIQHEEVRVEEERWIVQRLFKAPNTWRDIDTYNPIISVDSESVDDAIKTIVIYDTDYGKLTVEYFQRDGKVLKHNVYFKNTSDSEEVFRIIQRWSGIVGDKVNNKNFPLETDELRLVFRKTNGELTIAEDLHSMAFNPDGSEKTEKRLQKPIKIEVHAKGMKADFVYGNWTLAQDESLEIDPDTATLDNPTEDGDLIAISDSEAACLLEDYDFEEPYRTNDGDTMFYGGTGGFKSCVYRSYIEWNISSIAGGTLTANPVFKYHGSNSEATSDEINPITEGQPSSATDANLWDYIASGTAYVDPWSYETGESKSQDLGATAKTDLQTAATAEQSWFAIGIQAPDDECLADSSSTIYTEDYASVNPAPTLYITYTPAATTNIKSVNGLLKASVKSVNGLAIASVKSINGLE